MAPTRPSMGARAPNPTTRPSLPPVKQTVSFKPRMPQAPVVRRHTAKPVQRFPGATVTPVSSSTNSPASSLSSPSTSTLSSVTQKLSSSGVTLSKPGGGARPQGTSLATSTPESPDLARKFPHLNITNVCEARGPQAARGPQEARGPRPQGSGIQVKSPAQLLKPVAAGPRPQQGKARPQGPQAGGGARPAGASPAGGAKPSAGEARNKLAEFKEQMKKRLGVPGAQRKPAQGARQGPGATPRLPQPQAKPQARPPSAPPKKAPAPSKPGDKGEVVVIDID